MRKRLLLWTNTVTIISQLNFPLRDYKQRQICSATYCPIHKQIAVIKCCRKRCSILCFSTEIVKFSAACWEKRIRFIYKDKNHFHQWKNAVHKCCVKWGQTNLTMQGLMLFYAVHWFESKGQALVILSWGSKHDYGWEKTYFHTIMCFLYCIHINWKDNLWYL